MTLSNSDLRYTHLSHLPEDHLYAIVLNDAADIEYKKVAIQTMRENNFKKGYDPKVLLFEQMHPSEDAAPEQEPELGPEEPVEATTLRASVTTASLLQDEVVQKMDDAKSEPATEAATRTTTSFEGNEINEQ